MKVAKLIAASAVLVTAVGCSSATPPVPQAAGPVVEITIAKGAVTPTNATLTATVNQPIRSCNSPRQGAKLVTIPAPGTFDPDRNPPRVAGRNLLDASLGWDNVLHRIAPSDHVKTDLTLTATNLTNKVALYNFLSTFSGTHYVTPRAITGELSYNF